MHISQKRFFSSLLLFALFFITATQAVNLCSSFDEQDNPYPNQTLTINSTTRVIQNECVKYFQLDVNTTFDSNYLWFEIKFKNFTNDPSFKPFLIEKQGSQPTITSTGEENFDTSDKTGFYNRKAYQNLVFDYTDRPTSNNTLYFGLYNYFTEAKNYLNITVEYDVVVTALDDFPCPNNCSRHGTCELIDNNMMCNCDTGYFDDDCSVKADSILFGTTVQNTIPSYTWKYLYFAIDDYSNDLQISFSKSKGVINNAFLFQNPDYNEIPNAYENDGVYDISELQLEGDLLVQSTNLDNYQNQYLMIGIYNNNTYDMTASIKLKEYLSSSILRDIATYTMSGAAFFMLVAWGIMTLARYKHHKQMEALLASFRVQREEDKTLTKKDINKYFPRKKFRDLKSLFDQNTCSVCLEDFENESNCRQMYCEHIYHATCIEVWLNHHYNCPNCKKDMSKKAVEEYYKQKGIKPPEEQPSAGNNIPEPSNANELGVEGHIRSPSILQADDIDVINSNTGNVLSRRNVPEREVYQATIGSRHNIMAKSETNLKFPSQIEFKNEESDDSKGVKELNEDPILQRSKDSRESSDNTPKSNPMSLPFVVTEDGVQSMKLED